MAFSSTFDRIGMVVRRSTTLVTCPSARISSLRSITSRMSQASSRSTRSVSALVSRRCEAETRSAPSSQDAAGTTARSGELLLRELNRPAPICKARRASGWRHRRRHRSSVPVKTSREISALSLGNGPPSRGWPIAKSTADGCAILNGGSDDEPRASVDQVHVVEVGRPGATRSPSWRRRLGLTRPQTCAPSSRSRPASPCPSAR